MAKNFRFVYYARSNLSWFQRALSDLITGKADSYKNFFYRKPDTFEEISGDPLSQGCLLKVLGWIDNCASTHSSCSPPSTAETPKRLIYVGESDDDCIHLVSPPLSQGKFNYVALTHCWGGASIMSTNEANLKSRQISISSNEIPKTFQDAIKVTRWLGVKYLWIDSFCIVQDDVLEWQTEAAKMADIYGGSWVVIAACQADNCSTGFLQLRETHKKLSFKTLDGASSSLYVRRHINHHSRWKGVLQDQADGIPLFLRAWCLQERILGPRVLYFGKRELYFQCREEDICECKGHILFVSGWQVTYEHFRKLAARAFSGKHDSHEEPFNYQWSMIVEEYTGLNLTFEADRLPALSGIARLAESFHPGKYVAGMWEKELPHQLLWEVTRSTRPRKFSAEVRMPAIDEPHRQASIYAPSFSWTAWSEPVHHPLPELVTSRLFPGWAACEVVEMHATVPGTNRYGQISDAHIKLRGVLISFEPIYTRVRSQESSGDNDDYDFYNKSSGGRRPQISSDIWRNEDWDQLLFFGTLNHSTSLGEREVSGLILEKTSVEGTYTRVGIAIMLSSSWCDSDVQTVVTIV